MVSEKAIELSRVINNKIQEMSRLCEGIDEAAASRAPTGRWSPKEIISHLIGPGDGGFVPVLEMILSEDKPFLDLQPGNSHFTEKRAGTTFHVLFAQFKTDYRAFADRVAALSDEQLARTIHIPALKDAPMGEYPTIQVFIELMAVHHVDSHMDHMKEILGLLEVPIKS